MAAPRHSTEGRGARAVRALVLLAAASLLASQAEAHGYLSVPASRWVHSAAEGSSGQSSSMGQRQQPCPAAARSAQAGAGLPRWLLGPLNPRPSAAVYPYLCVRRPVLANYNCPQCGQGGGPGNTPGICGDPFQVPYGRPRGPWAGGGGALQGCPAGARTGTHPGRATTPTAPRHRSQTGPT